MPLDAEITVVGRRGADRRRSPPAAADRGGSWRQGSGERADERARAIRAGRIAGHAVETAVKLALQGEVDAIVTAPAHKHALHLAGFPYPGHTEWLAHLAGDVDVAMMLARRRARAWCWSPPTCRSATCRRCSPWIASCAPAASPSARCASGGASRQPRLAVCAVNPHAGESRACSATRRHGCSGPRPKRSAPRARCRPTRCSCGRCAGEFDAVLAPYHDVGMTAIKVAAFGRAVNVTLGLPFPRTSPDHGTALDIAGQPEMADASSTGGRAYRAGGEVLGGSPSLEPSKPAPAASINSRYASSLSFCWRGSPPAPPRTAGSSPAPPARWPAACSRCPPDPRSSATG